MLSKGFLGTQPLEEHLVQLVCVAPGVPAQTRPNLPLARITSSTRIYSIFQRGVVQQLNCCWPLKTRQRLPRDAARAALSGWCDLSAGRSEVSKFLLTG